jgi:hypothetical protein
MKRLYIKRIRRQPDKEAYHLKDPRDDFKIFRDNM